MRAPQKRPIIGIVPAHAPGSQMLQLTDRWPRAIVQAGGSPLILPFSEDPSVYEALLPLIDGFLLTGGTDVNPARYGVSPTSCPLLERLGEFAPRREELECIVLNFAHKFDLPVLGVCRGAQVMNVFFGGSLYVDFEQAYEEKGTPPTPLKHWQPEPYTAVTHMVKIDPTSQLAERTQARVLQVNSIHHQVICRLAPNLRATAHAEDGLIEAVEDPAHRFMLGVQWHPEFMMNVPQQRAIFEALIWHAAHSKAECPALNAIQNLRIERHEGGAFWPEVRFNDYVI